MSLLAQRTDFEPATPEEGAGALYYVPGQDVSYHYQSNMLTFQMRIDSLKGRFAPNNQKLAIWGCGFGYLVQMAVTAGYDAYGYDASQYAIDRAKVLNPGIANRVFLRNALVSGDMTPARRDAGLTGQQRFALLITEDLLECMSDAEIATALPLLRGICTSNLGHIITPPAGVSSDPRVNWKTYAQWKALLTPPDLVIGCTGETV